ncbi:unnamed protein product [Owenia fusiformis]|uniref:Carboxylesterase type B domain-containing protein n=1 Tax=Owenia fusiformis TaxID=6347 RepID=A0A8S4NJB4_OWEFU|nr:unnamed protein product [Owenia fusiformis]
MDSKPLVVFSVLLTLLDHTFGKVYKQQISQRVIQTKYGKIKGVLMEIPNRELTPVEGYFGIQYASLLGGELRFMPPTSPMEKWTDVRSAFSFRPACPQHIPRDKDLEKDLPRGKVLHLKRLQKFLVTQTEECLNLNIYVPVPDYFKTSSSGENSTKRDPYPVLVFIHGESYESGTGNAYDGSVLASFGQIIVITLNYRLGPLGFLTTGDSEAPGNYALLDIAAALHWIRGNIGAFHGDREKITVMGQGYGAALVNLLLVSPVTKGAESNLFKNAILLSGSALTTWAISHDPLHYTKRLADKVNCSHALDDSRRLLLCFKDIPYKDLVKAQIKPPKYFTGFGPVVDRRTVLPKDVERLMKKPISTFGDSNVLLGVMRNEGFMYFNQDEIEHGITESRKRKIVRTYIRNIYKYHKQKIYDILSHHYTDYERHRDPKAIRDSVMDMLSDGQYVTPMMEVAEYHSRWNNTYFYGFSYPSRMDSYPRWAGGVDGDDLLYIFGAPLADGIDPFQSVYTRSERMLAEAIMRFWSNFVKTGDPNIPIKQSSVHGGRVKNRFVDIQWPTFTSKSKHYLHIGMRPEVKGNYRANKIALWRDLIPNVHTSDSFEDTAPLHQLNDHDNMSSYASGLYITKPPPFPSSPTPPPRRTRPSKTTKHHPPNDRPNSTINKTLPPTSPTPRYTPPTIKKKAPQKEKDNKLSLSITIAVGCSLLFLNILIFAGLYYQKDKRRQREKEKEMQAQYECDVDFEKERDIQQPGMVHSQLLHSPGSPGSPTVHSPLVRASPSPNKTMNIGVTDTTDSGSLPSPPPNYLTQNHHVTTLPPPPPPANGSPIYNAPGNQYISNTIHPPGIPVIPPQPPSRSHSREYLSHDRSPPRCYGNHSQRDKSPTRVYSNHRSQSPSTARRPNIVSIRKADESAHSLGGNGLAESGNSIVIRKTYSPDSGQGNHSLEKSMSPSTQEQEVTTVV